LTRAVLTILVLLIATSALAAPVGRVDGPARERFDLRGAEAPRTRLLLAPGGAPLTPAAEGEPVALARTFLTSRLAPAGEMALLGTSPGAGGVLFVTFEQRFDGVPVALGQVTVAMMDDGAVLAARVGELAPVGPPRKLSSIVPDAAQAGRLARLSVGDDAGSLLVRSLPEAGAPAAERVLLATRQGARPAWRVRVNGSSGSPFAQDVFVAEVDGRIVRREPAAFGAVQQARVWPQDPTQPSVLVAFPDAVTNPSVDSPLGWDFAGETSGNNVRANLDRAGAFDTAGPTAVATGAPLVLDFPFTGDPAADGDAAVTNVFWALNAAHDRFRARGFHEAAGSFQTDSLGRGGLGGDRMYALVQYDSNDGTRAINYTASGTGADGSFSWIAVGIFEVADSGELRDAAFETDVLYHEYAHDAVTRLVGNDAACLGGVQPAALAEGWADFFAASFTDDPVIGAWVSDNVGSGLRQVALDRSNFSLLQLCANGCNASRDGEIWSGALWDLREDFIDLHGPEQGVEMVERLVVEGMRYTNCRPTFPDARDGLLVADSALFGAQHHCLIWDAMLGRGIGQGTETTGPDDELPLPGFGRPPECSNSASVRFEHDSYGVDADVIVEVLDATPEASPVATVSSPSGGSVDVPMSQVGSGLLLRGTIRIRPDAAGAGQLLVTDGETLTAAYSRAPEDGTAAVSGGLQAVLDRHEIWSAWCQRDADDDHDDTPGWWVLPGFLDAGESGDIYVTLANLTEAELTDLEVQVTSLSPDVRVLPVDPIVIGTIPAAAPGAPQLFQFDFKATAAASVMAGDLADIRFELNARGRTGEVILPLTLNMDYVIETGISPFAGGIETFEPDSISRDAWTHQSYRGGTDDWRLEACAGVGGSWGYGNMGTGCGDYGDDQGAPALVSPFMFPVFPPETQAYRIEDLAWSNDSTALGHDPVAIYCDLEQVAVFVTADPATLPFDDAPGVFNYAPQRVYNLSDAPLGYQASGPYTVNRGPQLIDPAFPYGQIRLAWVFWNDMFDDYCGDPDAVGHYFLDDIVWSYDIVRAVPEATPCAADCVLRIEYEVVPPGPKCEGEAFVIDASGTQVEGCAGEVYYSFAGPGVPPESGWTLEPTTTAMGADGANYGIYVECETDTQCNHYRGFANVSPAPPGVGTAIPGSLRVTREADDLMLRWLGAAAPPSYGVLTASSRAELAASWDTRRRPPRGRRAPPARRRHVGVACRLPARRRPRPLHRRPPPPLNAPNPPRNGPARERGQTPLLSKRKGSDPVAVIATGAAARFDGREGRQVRLDGSKGESAMSSRTLVFRIISA